MSLESAMEKLAVAMTGYAEKMQAMLDQGVVLIVDAKHPAVAGGTPAAPAEDAGTPEKTRKRRTQAEMKADEKIEAAKAAASAEPEAVDPFADEVEDEEEQRVITAEDIRTLVMGVKEKKGQETALKVIKAVGAETLGKIAAKDYARVVELCGKLGVTL